MAYKKMSVLIVQRFIKPQNVRLCFKPKSLENIPKCFQLALFNNNNVDHNVQQKRHFSIQSTVEAIGRTQTGLFRTLSESTPVEYCQNFLLSVHETTGLPWWGTIVCTTILFRSVVTVPLALYQNFINARLENIKIEMDEIAKELKRETSMAVKLYKWDEKTAKAAFRRSISKQWNVLIVRDNCHPLKSTLLIWFQIPLWISMSISLRNLVYMLPNQDVDAQITFQELCVGGFGFISNLTVVDSSLILPVCYGLLNLAIIEMQFLSKVTVPTRLQRYITNFFRGFSILMIPIGASVPSCLILYWTTSSAYGLFQNFVLMSPKVKRTFRIPQTPSELEQPYTHLQMALKHRIKLLTDKIRSG